MDLHRVQDDLQGIFHGEILCDDISRHLYSTDASIFQVKPAGIVLPRDETDVCRLVQYAQEQGIPLIARGAGTGLAGESLGTGLIVDFSKHFREIVEIGADTVRVQPGVTYATLNAKLAQHGRRFAPDPAGSSVGTIGGMLAINASGSRAIKHGCTRDHVSSLRVVLDDGNAVNVPRPTVLQPGASPSHLHDILSALAVLLDQQRDCIAACKPRTLFNRCGYALEGVLQGQTLDLVRLLTGSEGTLGLFTEATLRTQPIPGGRSLLAVSFGSLERALQAVPSAMLTRPSACELIDRRLLTLARGCDAGALANWIALASEAVLLIEFETEHAAAAQRQAKELSDRLLKEEPAVLQTAVATRPEELEILWQLREAALPGLYSVEGGTHPIAYFEDVAVPADVLQEYVRRVQDILQEHETTATFLVHAGAGQVHTQPFLDMQKPDEVARLWSIAEKVHALALALGGTVSSQHGTGLARTPWVARQCGPLYPALRQVKAIFDPHNRFNPGKIVDPDPNFDMRPVRTLATGTPIELPMVLHRHASALLAEAERCHGCGECRTEMPGQRMCPIFRATHAEEATPRAKANLLRQFRAATEGGPAFSSEEVRAVADLCVHCKMCALECPAHVDIPRLMLEAKAANVAEHGLDRTDWFFSQLELFLRWGSAVSFLTNLALGSRTARWLLDKLFGLSPERRLPRLARRPFLARARRRGWTRRPSGAKPVVVYFVDLYANHIEPQIGEATVAVLQHQGYDVYIPPEQRGSGLEALVHGDVETAREIAQKNLRALADAARAGWPIVCTEPSAALALRQDYVDLLNDDDARAIAAQTTELTAFLWQRHLQGRLRLDFRPIDISIGHHVPCHIKALKGPIAGPDLLQLIPKLRVHTLDVGCSGMAGTYGLKTGNHRLARLAGAAMLSELRRPLHLFGSAECSSCRMQMEDGAQKRSLHPIQYLALAYGLVPDVANRLREPLRDLVLR
jgi:FAD/FMN-containing dehydrogenase/Fe-S oxidoreductase